MTCMLTLASGLIVLWYEEEFCLSEHSLIAKKEQEVGISCGLVSSEPLLGFISRKKTCFTSLSFFHL